MIVALLDALPDATDLPAGSMLGSAWAAAGTSRHATQAAQTLIQICPNLRVLPLPILDSKGQNGALQPLKQAFQWLAQNAEDFGVNLILAPLADGTNLIDDRDLRGGALAMATASLRRRGILTVAAAGNGFHIGNRRLCQGMGVPAILRDTVSVGALEGLGLAPNSQRLALSGPCRTTCFAAPASPGGTSGAAAFVAGRLAARMAATGETGEDALAALLASGHTVSDGPDMVWPVVQ